MINTQSINWQEFKEALLKNPGLDLRFQYAENKWVDASYHITEIKQAPIVSVDCGGVINRWTEIIVQLWVPEKAQEERAMKVRKALSIIERVEKALPLTALAMVKIEFGNSQFDTRQMLPGDITADGENLIIKLYPDAVQCKAIGRGGKCGTNNDDEGRCQPGADAKPKVKIQTLVGEPENHCEPGSGCC